MRSPKNEVRNYVSLRFGVSTSFFFFVQEKCIIKLIFIHQRKSCLYYKIVYIKKRYLWKTQKKNYIIFTETYLSQSIHSDNSFNAIF